MPPMLYDYTTVSVDSVRSETDDALADSRCARRARGGHGRLPHLRLHAPAARACRGRAGARLRPSRLHGPGPHRCRRARRRQRCRGAHQQVARGPRLPRRPVSGRARLRRHRRGQGARGRAGPTARALAARLPPCRPRAERRGPRRAGAAAHAAGRGRDRLPAQHQRVPRRHRRDPRAAGGAARRLHRAPVARASGRGRIGSASTTPRSTRSSSRRTTATCAASCS